MSLPLAAHSHRLTSPIQFLGLIVGAVILVVLVLEWVGLRWERRWVLWTLLIFNLAAVFWLGASVRLATSPQRTPLT